MPNENEPDMDELRKSVENKVRKKEAEERASERPEAEDHSDLSDEELESRAEKKAKIAQLLDRGIVNDKLDVEKLLGDGYREDRHYEWVRETDTDIDRARALGFNIVNRSDVDLDSEEVHDASDDRIRIGDVILMSCDRERHELIQEAKEEKRVEKYGEPTQEYVRRAQKQGAPPVGQSMEEVT